MCFITALSRSLISTGNSGFCLNMGILSMESGFKSEPGCLIRLLVSRLSRFLILFSENFAFESLF
jgi:hypothetical protein